MDGQRHAPATLPLGKTTGTHCTGGWVGPIAGVGDREKSRHHRDSIPGPSNPQRVIIHTELTRPTSSKCGKSRCSKLLRVSATSEFQLSDSQTKGKDRKSCSGGNYLAAARSSTNCANISLTQLTNWGVRASIQTRHTEGLLPCFKSGTSISRITMEISFDA